MILMPIPFFFIRECASLSWRDALWGYERQMIGWSGIVDFTKYRVSSDSDAREMELSCLEKSDTFRVDELLRELASSESEKLGLISDKSRSWRINCSWPCTSKARRS